MITRILMDTLWVIVAIFGVAIIILLHEAGHYFAAKAVGVKVEQFSLGFGKEIVGWTRGETRYSIKWFLAGGSVRILGMNPEEEISEEDLPRCYKSVAYWRRAVIIVAGSAVHLLCALIIFTLIYWPIGYPVPVSSSRIGPVGGTVEIVSGNTVRKLAAPAAKVGLKKGDVITSINRVPVHTWDQVTGQLSGRPGQEVSLTVKRGNQSITVQPTLLSIQGKGKLGITPDTRIRKTSPVKAVYYGIITTGRMTGLLIKGIGSLFSMSTLRILIGQQQRNMNSPRSIVGAAQLAGQAAQRSFSDFLAIMGEIFLFLAIFNLIPLPPFDGGHLLVIVIEKVFGKDIDMRKLMPVAWVVIVTLSLVALRLAYLDIFRPLPPP